MTAEFDLATSYKNDHELADHIENVTWERSTESGPVLLTGLKGFWGDFDTPELMSLAAGLEVTNEAAAVVVWQPDLADGSPPTIAFAPAQGNILRRESLGNEGWMILRTTKSRFGHWLCACEKELVNG